MVLLNIFLVGLFLIAEIEAGVVHAPKSKSKVNGSRKTKSGKQSYFVRHVEVLSYLSTADDRLVLMSNDLFEKFTFDPKQPPSATGTSITPETLPSDNVCRIEDSKNVIIRNRYKDDTLCDWEFPKVTKKHIQCRAKGQLCYFIKDLYSNQCLTFTKKARLEMQDCKQDNTRQYWDYGPNPPYFG